MPESKEFPAIYSEVRERRAAGTLTPQRAIKMLCLDCSGYNRAEIVKCVIQDCPLYDFRLGKNPYRKKRVMTEEQRDAAVARLAQARSSKPAVSGEPMNDPM